MYTVQTSTISNRKCTTFRLKKNPPIGRNAHKISEMVSFNVVEVKVY